MNKKKYKIGLILWVVLIIVASFWYFEGNIWIIPCTLIIGTLWTFINYIIIQIKLKRNIWVGFGKKSIYYGNLIFLAVIVGMLYFVPGLTMDYGPRWMGIDYGFFTGLFFIISIFAEVWSYPVIIGDDYIIMKILDFNTETIKLNKIIEFQNEKDSLIFNTKKKKVEIKKKHIPINETEMENFIFQLQKLFDSNAKYQK